MVPGSGDAFYCENCLRDAAVAEPLRLLGHTAVTVPLYLPSGASRPGAARTAAAGTGETPPVFFGAVRLYLRHRSRLFSHAPAWMGRILDSEALLRLAARRAGSTRSAGLEEMTLSLLEGESGSEAAEVERLAVWLRDVCRPDVVHLSNALLMGLARRIRVVARVPVVCSLQDEDTWIYAMREPFRTRAWDLLRERSRDVAVFLPVSRWFGSLMRERLELPPPALRVVPAAVDEGAYQLSALPLDPPVLGYLSRMAEPLGLGRLVEAFIALRRSGFGNLRLHVMGGATADDRPFLRRLHARLAEAGALKDVSMVDGFSLPERVAFLSSLTLLSVPFERGEALGSFLLEAMAAGVPVVQPDVGSYGELVRSTGAGLLYDTASEGGLERALAALLADSAGLRACAGRGRAAVCERFGLGAVGAALVDAYRSAMHEPRA